MLDLPPSYLDFRIPEPPQEVIQEVAPYVQRAPQIPPRGQTRYMAYCSHPHCDNAGVWYTPSKATSNPSQSLQKYCLSHKQASHTAKELTSATRPTRTKRECPYDPEREERLALVYARDARQKEISDQRLHMREAGQLNAPPPLRQGYVQDTSTAETERCRKMMEDARGPAYQHQLRARQDRPKQHHHQFTDVTFRTIRPPPELQRMTQQEVVRTSTCI